MKCRLRGWVLICSRLGCSRSFQSCNLQAHLQVKTGVGSSYPSFDLQMSTRMGVHWCSCLVAGHRKSVVVRVFMSIIPQRRNGKAVETDWQQIRGQPGSEWWIEKPSYHRLSNWYFRCSFCLPTLCKFTEKYRLFIIIAGSGWAMEVWPLESTRGGSRI